MVFVNEEYNNYKYLVEASDNYVCLAKTSSVTGDWQNPTTIDVVYQYLEPSFLTIEDEITFTSEKTFSRVETTQSFYARRDCLGLIGIQFLIGFFILFLFNSLTRFVRKGGVIFGS